MAIKLKLYLEASPIFGGAAQFRQRNNSLTISLPKDGHLLAHTNADNATIASVVEPLVGREWRGNHLNSISPSTASTSSRSAKCERIARLQ